MQNQDILSQPPLEVLGTFAKSFIHKQAKGLWEQKLSQKYLHCLKDVGSFYSDLDRRFYTSVDILYGEVPDGTEGWAYDFKSIPKIKKFNWVLDKGETEDWLFIVHPQQKAFFFYHGEAFFHCERR
jgi:hypothetical protein